MNSHPPGADEQAEAAELARRAAQFRGHRISRETTCDRIRYLACSRDLETSPYAVITDSLDELCDELTAAQPAARPSHVPEPPANPGESAGRDAP
jgi:hypothetical protein